MTVLDDICTALGLWVTGVTPPRKRLEFPLRPADQARLAPGATAASGAPADPDMLTLSFTVTDPAPAVVPPFPGKLWFTPDPAAGGALPDPAAPNFDWTAHASWPTTGRIRVDLDGVQAARAMERLGAGLALRPTRAYLWPVQLPPAMLTEAALKGFAPLAAAPRTAGAPVPIASAKWAPHALVAVLSGRYGLPLPQHASDPARDAVALRPLPTVVLDGTGTARLNIVLARPLKPDDRTTDAELAALAGGAGPEAPEHPANVRVNARQALYELRSELAGTLNDAGGPAPLAATLLADWPAGPRWFTFQVASPGRPLRPARTLGALAGQEVEVGDAAGVLQRRPIPLNGAVTVEQAGNAASAPPSVTVAFPAGPLAAAESNVLDPADAARLRVDFAVHAEDAWAALLPILPADPATRPAARAALAAHCRALTASAMNKAAIAARLIDYAKAIRPIGWNATPSSPTFDEIFHGTREPWKTARAGHFEALFAAMDLIGFTNPAAPPTVRRPSHALLLWLMEGMEEQNKVGMVSRRSWTPLSVFNVDSLIGFTAVQLTGATNSQLKTIVRVCMFWWYFGMDDHNWGDNRGPDNRPCLRAPVPDGADLAEVIGRHNGTWTAVHSAKQAAGVEPPSQAVLMGSFDARLNAVSGEIECRPHANFVPVMIASQYAEYLRRLLALPAGAQGYPSFAYAAYNGQPAGVAPIFTAADAAIAADPVAWAGKDHEDVLMATRLPAGVSVGRGKGGARSTVPKVQILHVAALNDSWGAGLPNTW